VTRPEYHSVWCLQLDEFGSDCCSRELVTWALEMIVCQVTKEESRKFKFAGRLGTMSVVAAANFSSRSFLG